MAETATPDTAQQPFVVDARRCRKITADANRLAGWVAVCATRREHLEGPQAKAAAVQWAHQRYRITGAIDAVQGPFEDDGQVTPIEPNQADLPGNAGVVGEAGYRQMAAQMNLSKAAREPGRYILFVRVAANVL